MKLTLRPYQAEAIDALYQYWADKRGNSQELFEGWVPW